MDTVRAAQREAFVRARFAQSDVFGRADIEEVFAELRAKDDLLLSDSDVLLRLMQRSHGEGYDLLFVLNALRSNATPVMHPTSLTRFGFPGDVARMLNVYHAQSGWKCFLGKTGVIVIEDCADGVNGFGSFILDWGEYHERAGVEFVHVHRIEHFLTRSVQVVLEALLHEWYWHMPRSHLARVCLCLALEQVIVRERAAAEADFDRAVAVSASGERIIHADWVALTFRRGGQPYIRLYPGSAFYGNRPLLRPDTELAPRVHVQLTDLFLGNMSLDESGGVDAHAVQRVVSSFLRCELSRDSFPRALLGGLLRLCDVQDHLLISVLIAPATWHEDPHVVARDAQLIAAENPAMWTDYPALCNAFCEVSDAE